MHAFMCAHMQRHIHGHVGGTLTARATCSLVNDKAYWLKRLEAEWEQRFGHWEGRVNYDQLFDALDEDGKDEEEGLEDGAEGDDQEVDPINMDE